MSAEINIEMARQQMLGQQLRAWDVLDDRVLSAVEQVPREHFVPPRFRDLAFADTEIPLAHGQRMMAPKIEGRLLQALSLDPSDRVLEVGTGSGYLTACLAKLAGQVVSVDYFDDLVETARNNLSAMPGLDIELRTADAMSLECPGEFDAIAVTGSVPELDEHFVRMLRPGGRLFIVAGRAPVMDALLVTMHHGGRWTEESLFETVLTPLINAERPEPFVL